MTETFEIPRLDTEEGHLLVDNLLEASVDAALLVDCQMQVLYLTSGFAQLTGQTLEEYQGRPVTQLKIEDVTPIKQVLSGGHRAMGISMQIGGQRLLTNVIPVTWEGKVTGAVVLVLFRSMAILKRAIARQEELFPQNLSAPSRRAAYRFSDFIGEAPAVLTMLEQCHRIAHSAYPTLLIGETGVGKEILAGGIYQEYARGRSLPFIKINCSAIHRDMLESELFGHKKDAFTGSTAMKIG